MPAFMEWSTGTREGRDEEEPCKRGECSERKELHGAAPRDKPNAGTLRETRGRRRLAAVAVNGENFAIFVFW
jgi:hypothetical protein